MLWAENKSLVLISHSMPEQLSNVYAQNSAGF